MTPQPSQKNDSSLLRFDSQRVTAIIECLDVMRRLIGRVLGHGVRPEDFIQELLIEVRDLIEELSFRNPQNPPTARLIGRIPPMRRQVYSTPPPIHSVAGEPLKDMQKIFLGDLVIYLDRACQLLGSRNPNALPLEGTRDFMNGLMMGMIILLTDFLDEDLYEPYDLTELVAALSNSLPEEVAPEPPPPDVLPAEPSAAEKLPEAPPLAAPAESATQEPASIKAAIAQALRSDGEGWAIDSQGILHTPEEAASDSGRLMHALAESEVPDSAWSELFDSGGEETPAAPGEDVAAAPDSHSQELDDIHSQEVRRLFTSIARQFCQPFPSLLSNLQTKDLAPEHLEGLFGIVLNMHNSAQQFGYEELRQAMLPMRRVLEHSQCDPERLSAKDQLQILAEYDHLCVSFPDVFEPIARQERGQRLKESIIIMEELRAIKGLGNRRITRLFAAGISDLRSFCNARLEDFAAVSSIDRDLGERILMAFKPYEVLVAPYLGEELALKFREEQRLHLRQEIAHLRQVNYHYLAESKKPRFRERRQHLRELHRARELAMGRIRCTLAVLDEFELIESMRRIRYEKRLEIMENHLRASGLEPLPFAPPPSPPPGESEGLAFDNSESTKQAANPAEANPGAPSPSQGEASG